MPGRRPASKSRTDCEQIGRHALEVGQLIGRVGGPQSNFGVHQQRGGVRHMLTAPRKLAQRVHDECRGLQPQRRGGRLAPVEVLPACHADPAPPTQSEIGQERAQRLAPVARLAEEAERLVEAALQIQRADGGVGQALVAHQQQRWPRGADHQQGLLEARVITGEECHVGRVFPIAVDDQEVKAFLAHASAHRGQAGFILSRGQLRQPDRTAELRYDDRGQFYRTHCYSPPNPRMLNIDVF